MPYNALITITHLCEGVDGGNLILESGIDHLVPLQRPLACKLARDDDDLVRLPAAAADILNLDVRRR